MSGKVRERNRRGAPRDSVVPAPTAGQPTASVQWAVPLIVVAAGLAAYHNGFTGAFVFDDLIHIVNNPHIRRLWPLSEVIGHTPRPIVQLSLAVNHAVGGLDVRGYHAFNVAVHLAAGLLVFGVVRRTLQSDRLRARYGGAAPWLALAVATIWLVHPLHTESVTYVIQRAESLMGLFYLLTLYCALRGFRSSYPGRWFTAAITACALGVGSKQVMVTAPVVVLLYDRVFVAPSFGGIVRRRWWLYAGLAATWVVGAALYMTGETLEDVREGALGSGTTPWRYALTEAGVIVHYLRLAAWPHPLVLDYTWPLADTVSAVLPWLIIVLTLAIGTVLAFRRLPALGFVGAWFFLILAPTSSIAPIADPAFEHRMYLPLISVVAVAVIGAYEGLRTVHLGSWVGAGVTVATVACLGYLTLSRNEDYRSGFAIWTDTLAKRPDNARAHNNVGAMLYGRGDVTGAIAHYTEALRLRPEYAQAHNNLGLALASQGRLDEAIAQYAEALRLEPRYGEPHNNLGVALGARGKLDDAGAHFLEALRLNPASAEAHNNLGLVLVRQQKIDDAIRHYREAVRLKPQYVRAHYNLGTALAGQGKSEEAVFHYAEAVRLKPEVSGPHNDLGAVLYRLGRVQEAIAEYRTALRLQPAFPEAHHNLGLALARQSDVDGAITHLGEAVRLKPDYALAHNNLGALLRSQGRTREAIAHFSEAVRLDPTMTEARDNLRAAEVGQ